MARSVAEAAAGSGWEVLAAHSSRFSAQLPDGVKGYKSGSETSERLHALASYLLDRQGLHSNDATRRLIAEIERFAPDVINLHNVHGYYLNHGLLFSFLRAYGAPVVWTLHDMWALTGRCAFPEAVGCTRYADGCGSCPSLGNYPKSLIDRSRAHYQEKMIALADIPGLQFVVPSLRLGELLKRSPLSGYQVNTIYNGVDTEVFKPADSLRYSPFMILAVASKWTDEKGFRDFIELSRHLRPSCNIMLAGVTSAQRRQLGRHGIIGIERTESEEKLAELYRMAHVTVSLSRADTLPTVLLESLACGTPAVTYDTGGCGEIIADGCGCVVPIGDIAAAARQIEEICARCKSEYTGPCRRRALAAFDRRDMEKAYINLFNSLKYDTEII